MDRRLPRVQSSQRKADALLRECGHGLHDFCQRRESVEVAGGKLQHRRVSHLAQHFCQLGFVGRRPRFEQRSDVVAFPAFGQACLVEAGPADCPGVDAGSGCWQRHCPARAGRRQAAPAGVEPASRGCMVGSGLEYEVYCVRRLAWRALARTSSRLSHAAPDSRSKNCIRRMHRPTRGRLTPGRMYGGCRQPRLYISGPPIWKPEY